MVSVAMAVLLGVAGVLFWHSPWPIFIGLFLIWAGHQELYMLERQQDRAEEAEFDPRAAGWSSVPPTTVTVYIWDPRKHEWIPQGVVPTHSHLH
jgi:hypothetical protein